jgi:AcrR family transcriptional regulator
LGVNLNQVLRDDLGMTKGALYDHFPEGKDELVAAIIDAHNDRVDELYGAAIDEEADPLAALVRWTRDMALALQADPVARAGSRLTIERNLIVDLDIIDPYTDWTRRAARLLRRAAADGLLYAGVDPAAVARAVTASFFGIQQMSMALKDRRDLLARLDEFWELLLPSLRPGRRRR